jgi:hypothetical protein
MKTFNPNTTHPMVGKRIRLIHMDDPHPIPAGTVGTIIGVDQVGYQMQWENGRTLTLIPDEDRWEEEGNN